jgi:hypothetical protein
MISKQCLRFALVAGGTLLAIGLIGGGIFWYRSLPKFAITVGNHREVILLDTDVKAVQCEITRRLVPLATGLKPGEESPVFYVERTYTIPLNLPTDFIRATESSRLKTTGESSCKSVLFGNKGGAFHRDSAGRLSYVFIQENSARHFSEIEPVTNEMAVENWLNNGLLKAEIIRENFIPKPNERNTTN